MALIEWDEKYSVGIDSIDAQHKKLIGIINLVNEAIELDFNTTILHGIFEELVDYTKVHFKYEESLLKEADYKDYDQHSKTHRQFESQLKVFQDQFRVQGKSVSKPLVVFLQKWLTSHIMGTDKEYSEQLKSKHVS